MCVGVSSVDSDGTATGGVEPLLVQSRLRQYLTTAICCSGGVTPSKFAFTDSKDVFHSGHAAILAQFGLATISFFFFLQAIDTRVHLFPVAAAADFVKSPRSLSTFLVVRPQPNSIAGLGAKRVESTARRRT